MNSREHTGFAPDATFVDVASDSGGADPLALFESESESASESASASESESESESSQAGARTAPGTIGALTPAGLTRVRGPITLDEVLRRLGSVTWVEAVAIVEGLCGVLTQGGRARIPEMSGIAITEAGGVAVGTGGSKDAAGPLLARILHSLAATGSVPAPLRLFTTKWASASERHSIAEFATDLQYFSRPDGQSLIQAVYERAVSTVPIQPVQPKPRSETPRQARPPRRREAQDPRRMYAAAAAVIMLGVAFTAFFTLRGLGSLAGSTPAEPVGGGAGTLESAAETGTVPQGRGGQAGPGAPGSRAAGASTPSSGAPARFAGTSSALPVRPQAPAAGAPAPVSSAVRATLASPTASAASGRSTAPLSTPGTAPGAVVGLGGSRAGTRDVSGAPLYSRSDLDVTPPAFRHPQLPAQLLSGLQPDMNTIELIVSEAGFVERVRLLSTPKRMADMMLLSGAKNWEFEPALRDGQAVRYRLELSWAATP